MFAIKYGSKAVKVEFAKKHLETGRKTVNEIIYETVYNDIDAFNENSCIAFTL